jgi:pyridoxal phosphate enzyme (YggS family)
VAENFAWVHSVDRLKIAERLAAQRPAGLPAAAGLPAGEHFGEASKSGCVRRTARPGACRRAPAGLRLRGLMAIPEPSDDVAPAAGPLCPAHDLLERLNGAERPGLDTLSMGMSDDLEAAIMEGATIVRIGTAIFGERETTT